MNLSGAELFSALHPGFFDREHIRALPPEKVYEEQLLDLHAFSPDAFTILCPAHITFGFYKGEMAPLHEAVRSVEEGWVSCYHEGDLIYCAFDGERIVSFCLVDSFGVYEGLRFGGPGCVGTVPEYRKQGIGLKMVQNVTAFLKERGDDFSYIHYTGVGRWYARLGYETMLRWNGQGILS